MPGVALKGTDGKVWNNEELQGPNGVVVAFICNHCPFVLHIIDAFSDLARIYQKQGVNFIAISSNDPAEFPEDDFEHMVDFATAHKFSFPYLYDENQQTALAFNAICTPDFFIFDKKNRLFYTGQFDSSRPKINRPPLPGAPPMRTDLDVTGEDLRGALDAMLRGDMRAPNAKPSAGCSIKWKPENKPEWA